MFGPMSKESIEKPGSNMTSCGYAFGGGSNFRVLDIDTDHTFDVREHVYVGIECDEDHEGGHKNKIIALDDGCTTYIESLNGGEKF